MRLVEDQIVRVVGRGGGVGWAVVVVDDDVPHGKGGGEKEGEEVVKEGPGVDVGDGTRLALVPESYLEVVELDD